MAIVIPLVRRSRYHDRAVRALARLPRLGDEEAAATVVDSVAATLADDPTALNALIDAGLTDTQARTATRTLSTHLRRDL